MRDQYFADLNSISKIMCQFNLKITPSKITLNLTQEISIEIWNPWEIFKWFSSATSRGSLQLDIKFENLIQVVQMEWSCET